MLLARMLSVVSAEPIAASTRPAETSCGMFRLGPPGNSSTSRTTAPYRPLGLEEAAMLGLRQPAQAVDELLRSVSGAGESEAGGQHGARAERPQSAIAHHEPPTCLAHISRFAQASFGPCTRSRPSQVV